MELKIARKSGTKSQYSNYLSAVGPLESAITQGLM